MAGASKADTHLVNVNIERDYNVDSFADLKLASLGDKCPKCGKEFSFKRGIEVGHIFKLGTKYSASMKAEFLDESQQSKPMIMGCYGIGVSRVLAAAIEQNHDDFGPIWTRALSPFDIELIALDTEGEVKQKADELYAGLKAKGFDVLYDDRNERPGIKDADLVGVPHRLIVGKKLLPEGKIEYKNRATGQSEVWLLSELEEKLKNI